MKRLIVLAALMLSFISAQGEAAALPFPQHTVYAKRSIKPSRGQEELDRDVVVFYRAWKRAYLRMAADGTQCYVACNATGTTTPKVTRSISEGHGYGMLVLVLMAGADPHAQADFDAMFRFLRAHPAKANPALMAWREVARAGKMVERHDEDRETATDGDLDIACALLMADRQWGSKGQIDYRREAATMIGAIRSAETEEARHILTLGSWVDSESPQWGALRPSDFMPSHLKAFATALNDPFWTRMTDTSYRLLSELSAKYSPETGLCPDFAVMKGNDCRPAPAGFFEGKNDGYYSYNACRVPWRLATDYLLTGDERALALLGPLNAWIERAAGGDPAKINAGYRLDGTPLKEDDSAAFTGPLAVAAMADPARQRWLDALYADLLKRGFSQDGYYGNSIKLLTMIVISGNWWQP